MQINRQIIFTLLLVLIFTMSGCSAMYTAMNKRQLQTKTKMSDSIFLDPVPKSQRTILVQVHNTSEVSDMNVGRRIRHQLRDKGYQIVDDPERAHYLLQANILSVENKSNNSNQVVSTDTVSGGAIGAAAGAATHSDSAPILGGMAGSFMGMVANSAVKDVRYQMITDIQLSERPSKNEKIVRHSQSELKQGNSGSESIKSHGGAKWKRYRTRVTSTAEKVNLKFAQAKPQLEKQLSNAIAGLF